MSRALAVAVVVLVALSVAKPVVTMPLHPDLIEKLRAEGKLAEEGAFMEQAIARGFEQFGENNVYELEGGKALVMTTRAAVVIIVDFSDHLADTVAHPAPYFNSLLFSVGTFTTGSMRDYYLENSYGNFDVPGEVSSWYRMPQTYAYYVDGQKGFGTYPRNAKKMVEDAVAAADPYVDFSQYDNNGPDGIPHSADDDGYVDALFVIHSGTGYETSGNVNDIHSHAGYTRTPIAVDGVYINRYSMEPEDGKCGVFAHEFGHVLGLPDLYDYGYDSEGVGKWSLMASGSWCGAGITPCHIDAMGKIKLGYITPVVPTGNLIDVPIERVEDYPVAYKVWTNGAPNKEYFVVEHRRKVKFDFNLPSKGLVIYHVDENTSNNNSQLCGSGSPHYRVAVEQADGECDLESNVNQGDAGDPYPGSGGTYNPNTRLNLISTPDSKSYANAATGVSIYNIHFTEGVGYISVAVGLVPPTVTLSTPNGGELFEMGDPDTIRWIAFDDIEVDSVSILLSTDGGATFPTVLAHGEANDSSFVWNVAGPMSTQCRIRVVAYDRSGYSAYDGSDADFEIFDPAGVPATQPQEFKIVSINPNPSSGATTVVFSSPHRGVGANVYDITGRLVKALPVSASPTGGGAFEAYWDGANARGAAMSPGVYFVRVTSGGSAETARVTLTK
ncbi:MAG: M6 family metalloprotease domain-containing protein [Candidatus Eisenbacteria bacterium]